MLSSIRSKLKARLHACPACLQRYQHLKYRLTRLKALSYCWTDLRLVARHMYWRHDHELPREQLQAKLLFYYHKIEKGMCMPGKKRLFGLEVVPKLFAMLETWERSGGERDDPIYQGALHSLEAYASLLAELNLDPQDRVLSSVRRFVQARSFAPEQADTPIKLEMLQPDAPVRFADLKVLYEQRRSFRDFAPRPVAMAQVEAAVQMAQLSPSACNRQPCRVHAVRDDQLKAKVLSHQNGNAGFGHLAPLVLVITADMSYFFDATERHQPFVDGGLFTMSLVYALQAQGLVTCCLNWCVHPAQDAALRRLVPIGPSEQVIMLMAVGYPPSAALVPRSHRKSTGHVLAWH